MPQCSIDQRQQDGAALGKMRDRVYINSAAIFKKEQIEEAEEKRKAADFAPIFRRFKRQNIKPAAVKSRSKQTMIRPPPLCNPPVQTSSGYGTKAKFCCSSFTNEARGFESTATSFLKEYKQAPPMGAVPPKQHLCSNALAWAAPEKLTLHKTPPGCPWAKRPATTIAMARSPNAGKRSSTPKYQGVKRRASMPGGSQTPDPARERRRSSLQDQMRVDHWKVQPLDQSLAERGQEQAQKIVRHDGWAYYSKLTRLNNLPETNQDCSQFLQHFLAKKGNTMFPRSWVSTGEAREELEKIVGRTRANLSAEDAMRSKQLELERQQLELERTSSKYSASAFSRTPSRDAKSFDLKKKTKVEGLTSQMVDL